MSGPFLSSTDTPAAGSGVKAQPADREGAYHRAVERSAGPTPRA